MALRIVFLGTPEFAVPTLEVLLASAHELVGVVTSPDKPRGRGQRPLPTPVKQVALQAGIAVLEPESLKDPVFLATLRAWRPDLAVVVGFRILPPEVFRLPRYGSINLHASLLPRYRGPAPVHWAILRGEVETGVTTFLLEEGVDTGPILLQRRCPIGPEETAGELQERLMHLGARLVLETIEGLEAGTLRPRPQPQEGASYAPKVNRQMAQVPWHEPAQVVHNWIRGLSPHPGAWTRHGAVELTLYRSRLAQGSGRPGEVIAADRRLIVACGEGAVEILELQRPNRKRLSAEAFLRGYRIKPGSILDKAVQELPAPWGKTGF